MHIVAMTTKGQRSLIRYRRKVISLEKLNSHFLTSFTFPIMYVCVYVYTYCTCKYVMIGVVIQRHLVITAAGIRCLAVLSLSLGNAHRSLG